MARSSGAARERLGAPVRVAARAPRARRPSSSSNGEDVRARARPRRTRSRGAVPAAARGSRAASRAGRPSTPATATAPESRRMYSDLAGGQRGIDRHVGAARGQAGVVGDGPLRPVLGQDRHPVAVAHAQLAQADAGGLDPLGERRGSRASVQRPSRRIAHGDGAGGEPLDGAEIELGQRARRGPPTVR